VTERLARNRPPGSLVLSESSLRDAADVARARDAGADAVLVGTAVLLAEDLEGMLRSLVRAGWRR
jgi:indole-3-glycerol phosphate synthase